MEYRKLGDSDLEVSHICLGTMTWGQQNSEEEGHEQMDYALERGINFFDTAEMYSIPPRAETQGSTEKIIGSWFKKSSNREKIILASKVAGRGGMDWIRGPETKLDRENIEKAVEDSLKRLQTDYIDLYQIHWPDRRINIFGDGLGYKHLKTETVAISETLEVLSELVKSGKIRYVGLSNETPWGLSEFLKCSELNNLPKIVTVQNAYNLLNRTYEQGLSEFFYRSSVGLLAYSPLAQGYLTGKYLNGAKPEGARTTLFERGQRYETPHAEEAIREYVDYANGRGINPAVFAHAFVNSQEFVTSNIVGATNMEQLKIAIDSCEVGLSEEDFLAIEKIHYQCPNPCP